MATVRFILGCALCVALSLAAVRAAATSSPLITVIVGGGPQADYNQVAIESNVRYVRRLAPTSSATRVLFANGRSDRPIVQYASPLTGKLSATDLLELLLAPDETAGLGPEHYRAPNVGGALHGGSSQRGIDNALQWAGALANTNPGVPLLFYATGHGANDGAVSHYSMWNSAELDPRQLARKIERLPTETPLVLVMVQCHAGGFADVIFKGGDPGAAPVERDVAGFFAATAERMAAGCTPAINEAEYRDFTGYFFAAASGQDRVGRKIGSADYNRDGRIGLDEAYCYSIIHDESIDVPTCTSDAFLRRYVKKPDDDILATPWPRVLEWATPPQRAALEETTARLKLSGTDLVSRTWKKLKEMHRKHGADETFGADSEEIQTRSAAMEKARQAGQVTIYRRWPGLRRQVISDRRMALAGLQRDLDRGGWQEIHARLKALHGAMAQYEAGQVKNARMLRLVRLAKSVVLAHELPAAATPAINQRFRRLQTAEARSLSWAS